LTAPAERLAADAPRGFRHAWAQLMVVSLLWGVFLAWLWGTAWTVFGDYFGLPLMHVAAVVSVTALWLFRRSLLALGRCLGGRDPRVQNLVGTVALLVLALALLGLRKSYDRDALAWLPPMWQWACPMLVQRVLILAPLWGAWAMLIACQFCKPADDAARGVIAFAEGCSAPAAALSVVLPLCGTVLYLHFLRNYVNWWRLIVPTVTVAVAIAAGVLLCRRTGGLTRRALLASNFLTQLAFILVYLANR
jgi:hypothetical protein